jgi:hypothetical protein
LQHLIAAGASFQPQLRGPIDVGQVAILLDIDGTILDVGR